MSQRNEPRRAGQRLGKWGIVLLVFGVPVLFLLSSIAWRDREAAQRLDKPHIQIQKRSQQAWETLQFHPLSNSADTIAYLRSIPVRGQSLLSSEQSERLYSALITLFDAFRVGTFEAYEAFRLPQGADFSPNEAQIKIIRAHWLQSHSTPAPTNELALFKWWVEKQSGGDYYEGFWQQVCVSPKEIYSRLGTMNEVGVAAKAGIYVAEELEWDGFGGDAVYSTFHAGLDEYPPTFQFKVLHNAQGEPGSPDRKKLTAAIYFFVKPAPPDPVLPIGVRYVWDLESAQWLPIDLVMGNLNMRSGRSLVF